MSNNIFSVGTNSIIAVNYGLLYNWYAVDDIKNIANTGWRVPSNSEWETLISYLGGYTGAGGKLKQQGYQYWDAPNTGATNLVGFNARGSGFRNDYTGEYSSRGLTCGFYSSDEYSVNSAYTIYLTFVSANISDIDTTYINKHNGFSVRLIKDTTVLSHGETGTYTGNDGKVYRTICIGTQEWVADALVETKYRDGSNIPEVTDNSTWIELTTGAFCAYYNDWNNV